MEKVAVYLTLKEDIGKSYSISQKQLVDKYCCENNYEYDIYFDIVDSNLDIKNRSELDKLKENIESKRYNKVIIKDSHNLSRNVNVVIDFLKLLDKNNCSIECINTDDNLLNILNDKFINKNINDEKEL